MGDSFVDQVEVNAMDAYQVAYELERHASLAGFTAPQAYYIVGEFNLKAGDGSSVYSDEAHLWCKPCAEALLTKALPLLPEDEHEDHFVSATDAAEEDVCPHCMSCGETLRGTISAYAVSEEVAHYQEHPIGDGDEVNPRQAVEIAQILSAVPDDEDVLAIGRAALTCIARQAPT